MAGVENPTFDTSWCMRSRIPCTAERLSLLDPPMVQSVVEPAAFQGGYQYVSESRVRIVEADETQVTAAVIGNNGLYEQRVELRDKHLVTDCSCTLPEEPICRHCIAVLLEYHRWAPRNIRKAQEQKPKKEVVDTPKPSNGASADVKLSEIMTFVEWLQPAVKMLEQGESLPDAPRLGPGEVSTWIHTIRNLEERRRESEAVQVGLESDMREREAYVARLTQQLQAAIEEAKSAQAASKEYQRELASYKGLLGKVSDITREVGRFDGQVRSMANDLVQKGSQLEALAGSFKDLSVALKALAKSTGDQS